MKLLVIAAIAAASIASPAMAAELISNGSFSAGLTGWTAGSGDIKAATGQDYITFASGIGSPGAAANKFAAFGGGDVANVSTLSQAFTTISGVTCNYSFDAGAFGGQQVFTYTIAGSGPLTYTASGTNNLDTAFTTLTGSFVGTGALTSVSFTIAGQPTGSVDGFIDNVSITAVPEPATWAMMILGFGIIGFGMRKRSNVRTTVSYA